MARIRIGFVGLSAKRGWAKDAHLPYLSTSPHYEITGVVNSSLESSEAAIKELGLGSNAKAYGSVADLAQSPDVDFIVVSVKGPEHYAALKPALEAGKNVYVEWPLAFNLKEAEELAQLAKDKGVKTVVGAQGALEPVVHTVKKLIDDGAIGRVVSSEASLVAGPPGGVGPKHVVKYLLPKESSGVFPSIYFPHCELSSYLLVPKLTGNPGMQCFTKALGDVVSISSLAPVQYPVVDIIDPASGQVLEKGLQKTSPDHIYVHGRLASDAVFSLTLRGGHPISGLGCLWTIHGEKGDIQVTSPASPIWCSVDGMKVKVKTFDEPEREVAIREDDFTKLGSFAANIGRLYDAYRKNEHEDLMDFEAGLKRHRLIDAVFRSSESGKSVQLSST